MHAFLVHPFGTKNGIDFDRAARELISPALDYFNISGGTTGEFIQQDNILTDMFEQLLIADLVVANIFIHNANAFYELGLRHAFRDKRTFLIKSAGDEAPFDLKTGRYMPYNAADLTMLSSTKPNRVGRAYKKALSGTQDFERDSARNQLLLYQRLGILTKNTQVALDNIHPRVE